MFSCTVADDGNDLVLCKFYRFILLYFNFHGQNYELKKKRIIRSHLNVMTISCKLPTEDSTVSLRAQDNGHGLIKRTVTKLLCYNMFITY